MCNRCRPILRTLSTVLLLAAATAGSFAASPPQSPPRPAPAAAKRAAAPAPRPATVPDLAPPNPPAKTPPKRSTAAPLFRRIVFYVPNRVVDFFDVWRLNAGVGLGLGANVRPTKALQCGVLFYDTTRFGLRGRRWPVWHEWTGEFGFDGMYYDEGSEAERGFYEFGGTFHLFLAGLDGAFNIEEALDFLFGILLFDPLDDDFR